MFLNNIINLKNLFIKIYNYYIYIQYLFFNYFKFKNQKIKKNF